MAAGFRQGDQALMIDGVAVTASAAEVNKLDGAGAVVASGTQADNIADVPTAGSATAAANATAINAIIAAIEAFGISASS